MKANLAVKFIVLCIGAAVGAVIALGVTYMLTKWGGVYSDQLGFLLMTGLGMVVGTVAADRLFFVNPF